MLDAVPPTRGSLQDSLRHLSQQGLIQADLRTRRRSPQGDPTSLPPLIRNRLRRWRGPSPMFLPSRPGGRTGMPLSWVLWIVQTEETLPDPILRDGLAIADYALRRGGATEDQGLYVLSFVSLYRLGKVSPEAGDPILDLMARYQQTVDPPAKREAVSRKGRARVPTPPGPPAGGVRPKGFKLQVVTTDQGLLLYLPSYSDWLRARRQRVSLPVLQRFLRALPTTTLVPLPDELLATLSAREEDVPERSLREAWEGFRLCLQETGLMLPKLPTKKPRPSWEVPSEVARALRTLLGSSRGAYPGINRIKRVEARSGSFPVGYENGSFQGVRKLSRQEHELVETILTWAGPGEDEDPFLPAHPDHPRRAASPRSVWNRVRFERPLWHTA